LGIADARFFYRSDALSVTHPPSGSVTKALKEYLTHNVSWTVVFIARLCQRTQ